MNVVSDIKNGSLHTNIVLSFCSYYYLDAKRVNSDKDNICYI